MYENHVKLIIHAATPPEGIFQVDLTNKFTDEVFAFDRTRSRLEEMSSDSYLQKKWQGKTKPRRVQLLTIEILDINISPFIYNHVNIMHYNTIIILLYNNIYNCSRHSKKNTRSHLNVSEHERLSRSPQFVRTPRRQGSSRGASSQKNQKKSCISHARPSRSPQ